MGDDQNADRATESSRLLWAKLKDRKGPGYHPLVCHLIDVATVAEALWERVVPAWTRGRIATALGTDEASAGRWVAILAGLHDIGKATPVFQACGPGQQERLRPAGFAFSQRPVRNRDLAHGTLSAAILGDTLRAPPFALSRRLAVRLASVVGGHHGVLTTAGEVDSVHAVEGYALGKGSWPSARADLVVALLEAFPVPAQPPTTLDAPTAFWLAGLVSVADWIGSSEEDFAYAVPDPAKPWGRPVAGYAADARDWASDALRRLGWLDRPLPGDPDDAPTFARMFDFEEIEAPNAVQAAVEKAVQGLKEPTLLIVESPMGSGKTEAALYAADRWARATGNPGCYVALPTQATSNQMFGRVRRFLEHRYPGQRVGIQLLHGHAALSAEMEVLRERPAAPDRTDGTEDELDPGPLLDPTNVEPDAQGDDHRAEVVAAEWFTARKRGLLAPFGVGTVDQALLAALRTPHVFVRHVGLAGKAVVIDEVHAYDTYMTTLLERLLHWLAALGCTVVLLSATLPDARRRALAAAYARGLPGADEPGDTANLPPWSGQPSGESARRVGDAAPDVPKVAYPRLTWATAGGVEQVGLDPSLFPTKVLQVRWVDGALLSRPDAPFPLADELRTRLAGGGCVAIVCTTVKRAQDVFQALEAYFAEVDAAERPDLILFHARNVYEARARIEAGVLAAFGKDHPERRPARAILVATQVIEQSLDLDFDLMVSDPAPVDLILQRSGRLHRHPRRTRPAGFAEPDARPELWICRPDPDGLPPGEDRRYPVYDPHILLRSFAALRRRIGDVAGPITVPTDVQDLVEDVYDLDRACPSDSVDAIGEIWDTSLAKLKEDQAAEARQAQRRYLGPPSARGQPSELMEGARNEADDAPEAHPDLVAFTRLGPPSIEALCLYGSRERPTLDSDGIEVVDPAWTPNPKNPADRVRLRRLLGRSARFSGWRIFKALTGTTTTAVPAGWQRSALLRRYRLVILDIDDQETGYRIEEDPRLGLVLTPLGKEE